MKNVIKMGVALLICAITSLNAASITVQPQTPNQPKALAMATMPATTYDEKTIPYY
jgi:hypothetical protein